MLRSRSITMMHCPGSRVCDIDHIWVAAVEAVRWSATLQQAILNEKFIEEQAASGAKLLIEKNGSLRELVFNKAPTTSS
jgi:hypothetical protein